MLKIAIAGFRHGHIFSLLNAVREHPEFELAGCCEEDAATRVSLPENGIEAEWCDYAEMLAKLDCDVVGIGDYYGKRGAMAIAALKAGKHVLADKPLCTSLGELAEIRRLAHEGGLQVGVMLDLRDHVNVITAKKLVADGRIGAIRAINFTGQHPLNYGTRPGWYFEPGKHGGTINDIAIHGLDLVSYFSGCELTEIAGARVWNSDFPEVPDFQIGAQFMAVLANGAGVTGDVSYFSRSFATPGYWRFTLWGTTGYLEFNLADPGVRAMLDGQTNLTTVYPETRRTTYLERFRRDILGVETEQTTATTLAASEWALRIQADADSRRRR